MKILEVVCSFAPGGIERFVVDLCNEMSLSQDVTVLTLKDDEVGNNNFYKNDLKERVKHICLYWKDGFHFWYFIKIIFIIKRINPDIVHFHGSARNYLILANIFLGHKIQFVQTIHNDIYRGYSNKLSKLQIYLGHIWGKLRFVTISSTNYKQFNEVYPTCKQTMIVNGRSNLPITNDYNKVVFEVNSYKNDSDTLVFVHVARCADQKNQMLLINSFNDFVTIYQNAILLIIGAGFDSDLGKELQGIACSKIHFIGPKNNIADYYNNADAFILTSTYEGMPITIIEALLCGIPVLSTPVSGAIDVIENGKNGIISKGYSVEDVVEILRTFSVNSADFKTKMLRIDKTQQFYMSVCSQNYLNLFKQLCDE